MRLNVVSGPLNNVTFLVTLPKTLSLSFFILFLLPSGDCLTVHDTLRLNGNDVDLWEHWESLHLFWVKSGFKMQPDLLEDNDPVT